MATPTDDPAMTEDSAALAVDVPILLAVGAIAVAVGQAVYTRVWSGEGGSKPTLHYQEGSRLCPEIIRRCRTLKENYVPPLLWGKNGHVQTLLFSMFGRFRIPDIQGKRRHLRVEDGSTVSYDIFEPNGAVHVPYTIFMSPGIGNTSETDYVKVFAHHAVQKGYRVAILNHLGSLSDEILTGNRIFSYGGTGDMTAMYDDVRSRYPDSKLIGVGFSMGACILLRFLGEELSRQEHFVCAASVGQGYDPSLVVPYCMEWAHFRRLYNAAIAKKQLRLLRRHRNSLFSLDVEGSPTDADPPSSPAPSIPQSSVTVTPNSGTPSHGRRDSNGFSLDPSRMQTPDLTRVWSANSLYDVDEYYTRRVMGFQSPTELYEWTSCVDAMYRIKDLPVALVNSRDDPVVPEDIHRIPRDYAVSHPNALFVLTDYGGHLGYFEGGLLMANEVSWIDRFLFEYIESCIELSEDSELTQL